MSFSYDQAISLLDMHGQSHVLAFWDRCTDFERKALLSQVESLDFDSIARMKRMLEARALEQPAGAVDPAPVLRLAEDERMRARGVGEKCLRAGRAGVLLVAGGQGSRLGFDGPKGVLPIAPISQASLFAIHARKIVALSRRYGAPVPFYIMTSDVNDEATRAYFAQNAYFGLAAEHVKFFVQGMWPALSRDGKIILDKPYHIFMSPDGHGGILSALQNSGMLDDMSARNLETLFYFQVDNPMVDIADPAFIGVHLEQRADVSVKVCAKRDPDEGLGVVALRAGRNAIIEYIELSAEQKQARLADGSLKFQYGSVAIHVFSLSFLAREARAELPLHLAHKKVPYCDDMGRVVKSEQPNAYKFEKFVFDVLPDARRVVHLAFAREDEFSPVKNATGADSPETTRRDMVRKCARWLETCGVIVPRGPSGEPAFKLEIDPCLALDAEELKSRLPAGFKLAGDTLLNG